MFRQLLATALFIGMVLSAPSKVDSNLQHVLATKGTASVVVSFRQETQTVLDRINALRFETIGEKITIMKKQLEQLAESSQREVITLLQARSTSYKSFWINNRVIIKNADAELIAAIAAASDVIDVREEIVIHLDTPIVEEGSGINAEWGIERIQAHLVWALPGGNKGDGVVVGSIDSGVRHTHEALKDNFRADRGWYDPYTMSAEPIDENGHGTHTLGTIVGSKDIGVAPGATWIACRGCDKDTCTEAALTSCGQWTLCPTNSSGLDPDCTKKPAISSNSWGGGQGQTWFSSVVAAWHAADIIPVFSIGNAGPSCGSANSPGDMTNVIGVGSTTNTDGISSFSSRGPARNRAIKPDISAPGQNIRSAWHTEDTAYYTISGTSHAAPHVSGTIALLKSFKASLKYNEIKALLQTNAVQTGLGQAASCGGVSNDNIPNNVYGHGRVDALAALSAAAAAP